MACALVALAVFCVSVSAQDMLQTDVAGAPLAMAESDADGWPLAMAESDADGAPLAMAESEGGSCYQTDRSPEAMTTLAQKKSAEAFKKAQLTGTEFCKNGVKAIGMQVCCALSCGTCGGPGCSGRPGGQTQCCTGPITAAANVCASAGEVGCTQAAGDTLKSVAEAEYALAISNIAQMKTGALANAQKAYDIATTTASATHYQLALTSAKLKEQEQLHHDLKHVTAKRAKAEAEAVAATKLKMEAIARKHQSEVDLANGLAKRAGEQGKMAADEQLATDKATALSNTKASFLKIMNEHKTSLKVIRDAATAKIATLNTESAEEERRLKGEALTKKNEMVREAKTIYDAAVAKAGADEAAMKIRAESKKKVLVAEATNGATNAANQAWVKAFKDEMSFGAPCQAR